jgi:DegV family protein with EDD domain
VAPRPPAIRYLDGRRLRRLLLAGCDRAIAARDELNRINMFPVPDGDTGTNLALTLGHVAGELGPGGPAGAGELLALAAGAALDGARGNSGAILAQYLLGLATALRGVDRAQAEHWPPALRLAARQARGAVADPQEGTILSLMDALAEGVAGAAPGEELGQLFEGGLAAARSALARTRGQLAANRNAGVVDAGASGFCELLEGIADLLAGTRAATLRRAPDDALGQPVHGSAGDAGTVGFRYCTECLVSGEDLDPAALRAALGGIGDSVVVIGHGARVRIHAHVDEPARLFALAGRHGRLSGEKVDDMLRQQQAVARRQRVAVVTDSGADLPPETCDELGIHLVPLRINFGSQSYLDKAGLDSEGFFRLLAGHPEHPTTSQPAPADFRRVYEFLGAHHEHVLTVSLTRRLSGSWQAACAAARQAGDEDRFSVIDSHNLSLGQGLVAMRAAECARAGLDAGAVRRAAIDAAARTRCFGLVSDLRYAVRGGRLGRHHQLVAGALGIRPIVAVTAEGQVRAHRVVSRWTDPVSGLHRLAARQLGPGRRYRIAVGHAASPDAAARLADACRGLPGVESVLVTALGPTLGVHGGPGTLGFAVQELVDGPAAP